MGREREAVDILGIPFDPLTEEEALSILQGYLNESKNHVVVTPNPEGVMQARRNKAFAEALQGADLRLADGIGIVLAAKIKGKPLPGRVRGVDTAFALFERLGDFTAYFLGAAPGVAEAAKENMERRFPGLRVAGFHHGFFSDEEEKHILESINELSPDILLVCTGMPRAELWAAKNRGINAKLTMCLGGTMDIMAGTARLAPPIMRRLGLEWLYRLLKQPRRAVRMLDLPKFILAVLFNR